MTVFHSFSMSSHKSSLLMRPPDLFTTSRMGSLLWEACFQMIYCEGLSPHFLYRQGHGETREIKALPLGTTSKSQGSHSRISWNCLEHSVCERNPCCPMWARANQNYFLCISDADSWFLGYIFYHTIISLQMVFMAFICRQKLGFPLLSFPWISQAAVEEAQPQVSGITFIKGVSEAVPKDSCHQPWAEG